MAEILIPSHRPAPEAPATALVAHPLREGLRQMIAVLERERQALAALDADELVGAARDKDSLCDTLAALHPQALDGETRSLAETARQLNEVNRRVRNLLAANVAARIEALGGRHGRPGRLPKMTYAPARS